MVRLEVFDRTRNHTVERETVKFSEIIYNLEALVEKDDVMNIKVFSRWTDPSFYIYLPDSTVSVHCTCKQASELMGYMEALNGGAVEFR